MEAGHFRTRPHEIRPARAGGRSLQAGPEPELLGVYPMGEPVMATPAIAGGLLVVRTLGHVYALERAGAEGGGSGETEGPAPIPPS